MTNTSHLARALALAILGLILAGAAFAQDGERIKGTYLIREDIRLEEVLPTLTRIPFTQAEIDLFVEVMPRVTRWAGDNLQQWRALQSTNPQEFVKIFGGLAVWGDPAVGMTGREWLALYLKVNNCRQYESVGVDEYIKGLKDVIGRMEAAIPQAPPDQVENIKNGIRLNEAHVQALENYPMGNIELYRANQRAIDRVLDDMAKLMP